MDNSDNGWNDIIGTGAPKMNDTIDSVIDAFNSVISTNSDAILGSGWNISDKKNIGHKTKGSEVSSKSSWGETYGATNSQDESGNSWNSWGNGSSSRGNNNNNNSSSSSGWGNEDNQNYPTNNNNSVYTDDRRSYQDVNNVTDIGTNSYTDNNDRYNESTNEYENQSHGWSQPSQQQQQHHSYYEPQESSTPPESETSTDQNSETVSQDDDIKARLSAWHSLADPNVKERDDGIGGGQLHRRGRNYIPVEESVVLSIQQKGGGYKRPIKKGLEKPILKGKPIPVTKTTTKSVAPPKQINTSSQNPPPVKKVPEVKTAAPQNQKQSTQPAPPNRTQPQTQTLKKPSPPPSQSSQRQPLRDVPQPSWNNSQGLRDSSPSPRPQRSQQLQQPQLSQQPQQPQNQNSWSPQLVNTPFWESSSPPSSPPPIQHPSPKQYVNETISNKHQPIRHQSPARSPRPAKPVQECTLPYIPPEFDSTPYRNQPSPLPVRDKSHIYNEQDWKDNKYYEQDNNVENQRNKYYNDYDDSDVERQENKSGQILENNEPEKEQASRVDRHDRGQLLLTINVELSEGKTQAIEVHVNDDPMDLAKDFCDLWKVTNPVVMPALECLIKEEKEKRLGFN
ncbi:hypothetical protein GLOIN_2v1561445 [Rhizophagus clarus]|uniref:Uncharacterized protein n=1 Tax=Rhizophagus clarus TaxID=94130 RepID=A0A8H3R5C6_9GLOM|nr:hypothetical protein GLOIN_2v1561445 [Rhizophagus clarus]